MTLLPLPAFSDNYLWLLHDGAQALIVDPGEAAPVQATLQAHGLRLQAILVTHHHRDHVGGVQALAQATGATVYAPATEDIPVCDVPVVDGTAFDLLGRRFEVLFVPGHTAGHVAYYTPDPAGSAGLLFCGDTLFSGGCGRLFEGTPEQMQQSLDRLGALPGNTQVCCAHEYTISNLKFAAAVEPGNQDLIHYQRECEALRAQGRPTLPSTLARELAINPFLRTCVPAVRAAACAHAQISPDDSSPAQILGALRSWKNQFG